MFNDQSDLVDAFTYTGLPEDEDSLYSYQRENPVIRTATRQTATPFELLRGAQPSTEIVARLAASPMNGPFVNEADVLTVFSGYSEPSQSRRGNDQSASVNRSLWAFPVLGTPASLDSAVASAASDRGQIDARILDVFALLGRDQTIAKERSTNRNGRMVNSNLGQSSSEEGEFSERIRQNTDEQNTRERNTRERTTERRESGGQTSTKELQSLEAGLQDFERRIQGPRFQQAAASLLSPEDYEAFMGNESVQPRVGISHHRVNLNTAPMLVLASIPGITFSQAEALSEKRIEQQEAFRLGDKSVSPHLFSSESELLVDDILFPRELSYQQRLDRLRRLLPHVAFNSRSFRVVSQPRSDDAEVTDGQRVANRVQALVATDRQLPEILRMTTVQP